MLSLLSVISILSSPAVGYFARAGGGGSGGGGSGGGSGGGLLAFIGYLPSYYTAKACDKRGLERPAGYVLGTLAGLPIAALVFIISKYLALYVFAFAVAGAYSGMNNLHAKLLKRRNKSKAAMQIAANADPYWQSEFITSRVKEVFMMYQMDWSKFDTAHMQTYMTSRYVYHANLLMKALYQMGRSNIVSDIKIMDQFVVDIKDSVYNDQDSFSVYIKAKSKDILLETATNTILYDDSMPFEEIWHFKRLNDTWVLDGISQLTESKKLVRMLRTFAEQNNMYYSPDMGRLLLPKRGMLFGKANFKKSDINNHVIGEWGGLLVQLYTYIPAKNNRDKSDSVEYLVGQMNLPKTYGGIIIKRRDKPSWLSAKPKGYQKISFEWPDFNKRYDVYATDMDKVTSFELLNPSFMAELYDSDLKVKIEVVDSIVYLYCNINKNSRDYSTMLRILQRSYAELNR